MSSRTLVILKPDALERGLVDSIVSRFIQAGFTIEHLHYRVVDFPLIKTHYKEVILREGDNFVPWLKEHFVSKPSIPMILLHPDENGIEIARNLLGNRRPELAEKGTIRGDYGIPVLDPTIPAMNLVHASDSTSSFDKESHLWFKAIQY